MRIGFKGKKPWRFLSKEQKNLKLWNKWLFIVINVHLKRIKCSVGSSHLINHVTTYIHTHTHKHINTYIHTFIHTYFIQDADTIEHGFCVHSEGSAARSKFKPLHELASSDLENEFLRAHLPSFVVTKESFHSRKEITDFRRVFVSRESFA